MKMYNRVSNMLDSDDRRVLGQVALVTALGTTAVVLASATLGLAVRVFMAIVG